MKRAAAGCLVLGLLANAGCTPPSLTKIGGDLVTQQGVVSTEQLAAITETGQAFRSSFQDLTEEEEYYLGRAVAAQILSRYRLRPEDELSAYVREVGRAVSAYSTRPETFGGYHFAILDDAAVNAFAAPGGTIFVTSGLLAMLPGEESLAGVLAHEVAHVANRHGLSAIRKSRLTEAFGILGRNAGTQLNRQELLKLTEIYEGAVGDVFRTLVESGYDRGQEEEADEAAMAIVKSLRYRSDGLPAFLDALAAAGSGSGKLAMFQSHPPSSDRESRLRKLVTPDVDSGLDTSARDARFGRALACLGR
ncbi:M48 family metalloprotease [bacterium]|nr:M48 family metalloprotease [bacterium]